MNYTKGKWEAINISAGEAGLFPYVVKCPEGTIARVTTKANAHLIAAAPRMAAALDDIIKAASFCHADAGLKIWIDKAKEILNTIP